MPTPKSPRPPKASPPPAAPLLGPDAQPLPPVPPVPGPATGPIRPPSPAGSQPGVQAIGPVSKLTPVPRHMGTMLGGIVVDPKTGRPEGLTAPEAAQWDATQLVEHRTALLKSAAALQLKAGHYLEALTDEQHGKFHHAAALLASIDLDALATLHLDLEALLLKHHA